MPMASRIIHLAVIDILATGVTLKRVRFPDTPQENQGKSQGDPLPERIAAGVRGRIRA